MTPIEIIRAVNGKAITVRAALQIIAHQKETTARRVLEYYKKRNHANDLMAMLNFQPEAPTKISPRQCWLNTDTGEGYTRNKENTKWVKPSELPPKIAVLSGQIRQELG